jgi:hypothetical protein
MLAQLGIEPVPAVYKQLLDEARMYPSPRNQHRPGLVRQASARCASLYDHNASLYVFSEPVRHRLGHNFGHAHNHIHCHSGLFVHLRWLKRPSLRKS